MITIELFKEKSLHEQQRFLHESVEYCLQNIDGNLCVNVIQHVADPLCKWYAIKALGELCFTKAIDVLVDVLKVDDVVFDETSIHLITAFSLGKIGEDALPCVINLLSTSDNIQTQKAAVDALGEIRSINSIPYLLHAIEFLDYQVALWAGLAIGKIGHGSTGLIDIYDRISQEKKMIVIDSLMRVNEPTGVRFIINELYSNSDMLQAFKTEGVTKAYGIFLDTLLKNGLRREHGFFTQGNVE